MSAFVYQEVQVGLGLVVEDELSEHSYILLHVHVHVSILRPTIAIQMLHTINVGLYGDEAV